MDINARRMELDEQISQLYKETIRLNEEIADEDKEFRVFLESALASGTMNWPEGESVACPGIDGSNSQEAA